MASLVSNVLTYKNSPATTILDSAIDLGLGTALGVSINDLWETNKLPGYGQKIFDFDGATKDQAGQPYKIGVGVDDVVQAGIGVAAMLLLPSNKLFGLGIVAGTVATKVGEYFGKPVSLSQIFSSNLAVAGLSPGSTSTALNNTAPPDLQMFSGRVHDGMIIGGGGFSTA